MPWLSEPRLNQPMSSPIVTRILGFLSAASAEVFFQGIIGEHAVPFCWQPPRARGLD